MLGEEIGSRELTGAVADGARPTRLGAVQPRYRLYGGWSKYRTALTAVISTTDHVAALETELAEATGRAHAIAMPQARVGIYLLVEALVARRGCRQVVMSPYTIHDVVNMVIAAGGHPVFVDVERETCNVGPAAVAAAINDQTAAVIVTHLHGLVCDVPAVRALCAQRGIPVLEDTAQAYGARLGTVHAGSLATAGVFSFGMAKNVNGFYGGAVVTDDPDLASQLRRRLGPLPPTSMSVLARRVGFCLVGDVLTSPGLFPLATARVFRFGHLHQIEALTSRFRGEEAPQLRRRLPAHYLRRLTRVQAAVVREGLRRVDRDTRERRRYAHTYHDGLCDLEQVVLPPRVADDRHVYLTFPLQVPDREALLTAMIRDRRDVAIQHLRNNADAACFAEFARDCPEARRVAGSVLLLPTYPGYGKRAVEANIESVRRFFGR